MKHSYLIEIQFLGYRYHGWMIQPKVKTVQEMFDKTIAFIYEGSRFKTFGTSRTDSKVSATQMGVHLLIDVGLDLDNFLAVFNKNLPNDIKALTIKTAPEQFNPLDSSESKHYVYLFAFGEKPHPFSASLIHTELNQLDLALMQEGAELFEGTHNLRKYCTKPSPNTNFIRTISFCKILPNDLFSANFFPEKTYALHIKSEGFMRYQVRLIMGQLLALGRGELSLKQIKNSLDPKDEDTLRYIAPGSGLILYQSEFKL